MALAPALAKVVLMVRLHPDNYLYLLTVIWRHSPVEPYQRDLKTQAPPPITTFEQLRAYAMSENEINQAIIQLKDLVFIIKIAIIDNVGEKFNDDHLLRELKKLTAAVTRVDSKLPD